MSFLIAVPTGIKFFNWIGTMWGGKLTFDDADAVRIGFMVNFLIGGITGVMLASAPVDFARHGHVLRRRAHALRAGRRERCSRSSPAIYYWFPKMTGRPAVASGSASLVFWLTFVGFNLTFWPLFVAGLRGMPRRMADVPAGAGWTDAEPAGHASGSYVHGGRACCCSWWNVVQAYPRARSPAGDDPWGGYTLEWITTSPPPEHNFHWLPPIRSERPVFDWRHSGRIHELRGRARRTRGTRPGTAREGADRVARSRAAAA